jgi:hypothetical protein
MSRKVDVQTRLCRLWRCRADGALSVSICPLHSHRGAFYYLSPVPAGSGCIPFLEMRLQDNELVEGLSLLYLRRFLYFSAALLLCMYLLACSLTAHSHLSVLTRAPAFYCQDAPLDNYLAGLKPSVCYKSWRTKLQVIVLCCSIYGIACMRSLRCGYRTTPLPN